MDQERSIEMKCKFMIVPILLLIASVFSAAADEGDALYKKKCAGCHGAGGEGKPAVKAPALKGTALDVAQLVDHITKGEAASKPPHNKGIAGLSGDQANAIAEFVKSLK
jgi:mono/diheme cytochrome c family protein